MMKNQIEQLQAELLYVKGDSSTPFEELQILKQKIALLETSNTNLQKQLQEYQVNVEHLTKQATDAQFEKDKLLLKIESARDGKPWDEIDCDSNKDVDVLKSYKSRIQQLEGDLLRSKRLNTSKRTEIDYLDLDDHALHPKTSLFPESDSKTAEAVDNFEVEEKELEHCSLQEKLDNELKELDKRLEQKEAEMKRVAGGDTSVLKQHYEKKVQDLEQEKRNLQKEIEQLRCNLANISSTSDDSTQKLKENYLQKLTFLESQFEKDKLLLKIESARDGKPWDEIDCDSNKDVDVLKSYKSRIQQLEGDLLRSKRLNTSKRTEIDYLDLDDHALHPKTSLFPESDSKTAEAVDNFEVEEKELEHCSLQEKLDNELKELDKRLEQKEAEMKRVAGGDTSVLKQHYEKKVQDLEQEKRNLQKEIEQLRCNLANISSTSDDSTQKLKENYLQKLTFLESQVAELKKKQDAQAQLLRQKQRSDEAAKRLQDEIHRIKTQKVQLQQKIKQESEQFRLWKASREKEVLQLKKEGRRNEYEMHKLLALNQRQKMVLQRKTEEASMATKRLKDVLESRKTSRETYGSSSGPGVQALLKAIEHELEVTVRVHEVRCEYERQKEERLKMAKEVAELKDEANLSKQIPLSHCSQTMSPGARNSRIYALENMLATSSSTIVSMASQLSEAEERERAFSGKGRWNHVRSLADAKTIMNNLFNLASSSRCHLWDKEVACREKDSEIRGLKEKIVSLIRQVDMQKAELTRQEKLNKLMSKSFKRMSTNRDSTVMEDVEGHAYDLRPKGLRNSIAFYGGSGNMDELLEDMDTSESEHSDLDEEDIEWLHSEDFQDEMGRKKIQNAKKRNSRIVMENNTESETHKTSPSEENTTTIQKAQSV
nr:kinesin-like protein KIN-4C [Tanacetum cinerariifolium]